MSEKAGENAMQAEKAATTICTKSLSSLQASWTLVALHLENRPFAHAG